MLTKKKKIKPSSGFPTATINTKWNVQISEESQDNLQVQKQ